MIATFTDFGPHGPYLGQVRAVLHHQAPGIPVVDVFPDLPAFNVRAAAYLLPAYSRCLPVGTVCLCVVDPGVGTGRGVVALQADGRWYVAPDNGLLSLIVRHSRNVSAYTVTWRPSTLSSSFHGRDLFAPICARLANGERPEWAPVEGTALERADWPDDLQRVVYIDGYGNAITGLRADRVPLSAGLEILGTTCRYSRTFAEAPPQTPFWYANANGLVEIAMAGASVRQVCALDVGQEFRLIALS